MKTMDESTSTPRSSERLKKKQSDVFQMPTTKDYLDTIEYTPTTSLTSLRPRKLINNFISERNRYNNSDGLPLSEDDVELQEFIVDTSESDDSESLWEFLEDSDDVSARETSKKQRKLLSKKRKPLIELDTSDEDFDDESARETNEKQRKLLSKKRKPSLESDTSDDDESVIRETTNTKRRKLFTKKKQSFNGDRIIPSKRKLKMQIVSSDDDDSEEEMKKATRKKRIFVEGIQHKKHKTRQNSLNYGSDVQTKNMRLRKTSVPVYCNERSSEESELYDPNLHMKDRCSNANMMVTRGNSASRTSMRKARRNRVIVDSSDDSSDIQKNQHLKKKCAVNNESDVEEDNRKSSDEDVQRKKINKRQKKTVIDDETDSSYTENEKIEKKNKLRKTSGHVHKALLSDESDESYKPNAYFIKCSDTKNMVTRRKSAQGTKMKKEWHRSIVSDSSDDSSDVQNSQHLKENCAVNDESESDVEEDNRKKINRRQKKNVIDDESDSSCKENEKTEKENMKFRNTSDHVHKALSSEESDASYKPNAYFQGKRRKSARGTKMRHRSIVSDSSDDSSDVESTQHLKKKCGVNNESDGGHERRSAVRVDHKSDPSDGEKVNRAAKKNMRLRKTLVQVPHNELSSEESDTSVQRNVSLHDTCSKDDSSDDSSFADDQKNLKVPNLLLMKCVVNIGRNVQEENATALSSSDEDVRQKKRNGRKRMSVIDDESESSDGEKYTKNIVTRRKSARNLNKKCYVNDVLSDVKKKSQELKSRSSPDGEDEQNGRQSRSEDESDQSGAQNELNRVEKMSLRKTMVPIADKPNTSRQSKCSGVNKTIRQVNTRGTGKRKEVQGKSIGSASAEDSSFVHNYQKRRLRKRKCVDGREGSPDENDKQRKQRTVIDDDIDVKQNIPVYRPMSDSDQDIFNVDDNKVNASRTTRACRLRQWRNALSSWRICHKKKVYT